MKFFNFYTSIITRKESAFAIDDLPGLWRIHWQINQRVILSTFYTRHDQACLLWAVVAGMIFAAAQFLPISWTTQAMIATVLTLVAVLGMMRLTWRFTREEHIVWILYSWVFLMLTGTVITDLSVFLGWGEVLIRICPLWLGLSAVGYFLTGLGMQSRTFIGVSILHLLTVFLLPYVGIWKPLVTGILIGGTVLLIAELQWDSNGVCQRQNRLQESLEGLHENLIVANQSSANQSFLIHHTRKSAGLERKDKRTTILKTS